MRPGAITAAGVAGLAGLAAIGMAGCHKTPPAEASASAPAAAPAASLTPASLPQRKAGLWSQQIVVAGAENAMPATQICLDATSDAQMSMIGAKAGSKACQAYQINRNLDGTLSFSSSCDLGSGGKVVSTGRISGDFNSTYTVQIDSTTTGASFAGANGEHKMTIVATYQGPCPAGWVGGDMSVNGMRMNMLKGAAPAPAAPPAGG